MNLLLTSTGFAHQAVSDAFLKLLRKPVGEIRVLFIPTASRTEEEKKYVEESRQELVDFGIKKIMTLNLDHRVAPDEIADADVIYVCGGNTFYLLQKIRESGFDEILPHFEGLVVGVSAGSIVLGPNIEVAAPWDENDVHLSDTTGLKLVDFAVIPHYQKNEHAIVNALRERAKYEIVELTDEQAALIQNGERTMIGDP